MVKRRNPLAMAELKELHQTMFPQEKEAGQFKSSPNITYTKWIDTGEPAIQLYVTPDVVNRELDELILWLNQNEAKVHPVVLSAIGHYNFVRIHPFSDGNGRVGRLFGNMLLLRNTFTPVVIYPSDRSEYMHTLSAGHQKHNLSPFTEFIAKRLLHSQQELIQDKVLLDKRD